MLNTSPSLAQFSLSGADPNSLPQLPSPPLWESWLFESPLTPAIGLLLIGVIALVMLNRAGQAREGVFALVGCIVLAGGVWLTAALVTTQREHMVEQTRVLVRSTASRFGAPIAKESDPPLEELVASDVVLTLRGQEIVIGRESLVGRVDSLPGGVELQSVALLESSAQSLDRNSGFTQIWIRAEASSALDRSWWRVGWRRESDPSAPDGFRWRATSIDCLQSDWMGSIGGGAPSIP